MKLKQFFILLSLFLGLASHASAADDLTWVCQHSLTVDQDLLQSRTGFDFDNSSLAVLEIKNSDFSKLLLGNQNIEMKYILQFDLADWKNRTIIVWASPNSDDVFKFVLFQNEKKAHFQIDDGDVIQDLVIFKGCNQTSL